MKFSLNLASFYANVNKTGVDPKTYDIDEVTKRLGLQLGAIESVEEFSQKYQHIYVVKIISCDQHPNADKLKVCTIDDNNAVSNIARNSDGYVQVVCGAPNVREGIFAAWIPPGATVPSTYDGDQFTLESRELRGQMSNGMLASPAELHISDDHDGILVVENDDIGRDPVAGEPLVNLYGLDDVVIDCENKMFTHRPDCFGNMGIARELSGIFGDAYTSPEWYKSPLQNEITANLPIKIENNAPELVSRFMMQAVADVSVKSSPMWLQSYLKRIGLKSINNIVDYTNYFMMSTGQPLHAYDYDKVKKLCTGDVMVQARRAKEGEKLALLNGATIELTEDDIVIATDQQPIGLAGVMGGAETEVDENTKNVIIECATFDMYAIRRTSMRHGLFTDAVTRFNKGQSPLQNDRVLAKMVRELVEYADGKPASEVLDSTTFDVIADNLNHLTVRAGFVNKRLGSDLSLDEMKQLLENVEFEVEIDGDSMNITVPFWRMDISIAEDVVEEIGRLHGYLYLPIELPLRTSKPAPKNELLNNKQHLRNTLMHLGANEIFTYSFVHGDLLKKAGINPEIWAIKLRNALSPELQYFRPSLLPSLLAKVHSNLKATAGSSTNEFAIFELGKVHVKGHHEEPPEDNLPKQMRRLSFVIAADQKTAKKYSGSAYYHAKKYADAITGGSAQYQKLDTNDYPITAPYQIGKSAVITLAKDKPPVGVIGELKASVKKALKLPDYCAAFEIDVDYLVNEVLPATYQPLSSFPSSSQDVTFEIDNKIDWADVTSLIRAELEVARGESGYHFSITPGSIYQSYDSQKKRISYTLEISHPAKTLQSSEVTSLIETIADAIENKFDAERI